MFIDTLGKRLSEIVLPIPKSSKVREKVTEQIKSIVLSRIDASTTAKCYLVL